MGVWAEHTWPALGVERASSELLGSGSQVSRVSIAAGNTHFVGSWVPIYRHPVSGAEGCRPQVRELGLGGAGRSREPHIPFSLLAQFWSPLTWGRRKASIGVKAFTTLPLCIKLRPGAVFPSSLVPAARSPRSPRDLSCLVISSAGTPQPLLWLAGPALLLALCRPAGPLSPAGMGKGRVHQLHPRNLVGCMD